MATPVKAITYLSGIYPQAQTVLVVRPLPLAAQTAVVMRMAPPLWRPICHLVVQTQAKTILVPRPLVLGAMTALKLTLFWRKKSGRPDRGQLWPRTR